MIQSQPGFNLSLLITKLQILNESAVFYGSCDPPRTFLTLYDYTPIFYLLLLLDAIKVMLSHGNSVDHCPGLGSIFSQVANLC